MISYRPLWTTMKEKNISTYVLITQYNINSKIINNMKHDKGISTITLEKICVALQCTPNDVIEFINA